MRLLHPGSMGKCDVVAHFFRRAFGLLRTDGTSGLIATNTIAQGDTRSTGLRWICKNGGEIYQARRRVKWPGLAAVVVSVLHVHKGRFPGVKLVDGKVVGTITAFLFHRGRHDDPARLETNAGKSFQGTIVLGMGFTFDDFDKKGIATTIAEMHRLIAEEPRNRDAIYPYIGGEEVNTSPTHAHHRYAIHFHDYPLKRKDLGHHWSEANEEQHHQWLRQGIVPLDYSEPVAADWSELLEIVETNVKPERLLSSQMSKSSHGRRAAVWWQHYHQAKDLRSAIARLDRVLVVSRVGQRLAFALLRANMVYADSLVVFPLDTYAAFCTLQSRPHEIWARFLGSSMKDDLRYTPSDCFETFPFPDGWSTHPDLEHAGTDCYRFRADFMVRRDEGLTKTYNRFHDPDETQPEVTKLRDFHSAMDRTVLDAYGWTDIPTACEFLLDYEIDEEDWGTRKKPYRYRWPDEIRDEVLARLLELNAERAAAEQRAGRTAVATSSGSRVRRSRGHAVGGTPAPVPTPGTLWDDTP